MIIHWGVLVFLKLHNETNLRRFVNYNLLSELLLVKLFVLTILLLSISINFGLKDAKAKSTTYTITEDFTNSSNLTTLEGATIQAGSLVLSDDGVSLNEDFNSYSDGTVPSGWSRESTAWQIASGTYSHLTNAYDNSKTVWDTSTIKNGSVQADLRSLGGEQFAGIVFRYQDSNNFYVAYFSSLYDVLKIDKVMDGTFKNICEYLENYDLDTPYTIKVEFLESNFKVYVNGTQKLDCYDSEFPSAGKVGFWRNGSGMRADNLQISSLTYIGATAVSKTYSYDQNIRAATLNSFSSSNSNAVAIYVSNDDGVTWQEITSGEKIYFKTEGTGFKYRIDLHADSINADISQISFDVELGTKDTINTPKSDDLYQLHYTDNGNPLAKISAQPENLTLYHQITGREFVQQALIDRFNNKTVMYYVDDNSNTLRAFDLDNKVELWSTDLSGYTEGTPYIDRQNEVIYIGSYAKKMFAINQNTGAILWSYSTTDTISGAPIHLRDNLLFFADYGYAGTTTLYALNVNTQTLTWSFPVSGTYFMSFTLDPALNRLYATYSDYIVALNLSDGSEVWRNKLGLGYITKQPVVYGPYLAVGADRAIFVLKKSTGEAVWKSTFNNTEDGLGATPVIKDNIVYYPTKNDAKIYARNLLNGNLVWQTPSPTGNGTFSSGTLTEDGILYISYEDAVRAIDISDGSIVWTSPQGSWAENEVAIAHGYLVFTDETGSGTINIYQITKESYSSSNGISIKRDSRNISGISISNQKVENFTCDADTLTINDSGTVVINFGINPIVVSNSSSLIINELHSSAFRVCGSGTASFTINPRNKNFNTVLKDGQTLDTYTFNGQILTITDSFSAHTYKLVNVLLPGAPNCNLNPPNNPPPQIKNIDRINNGSAVRISWTKASEPFSHYVIYYKRVGKNEFEYATGKIEKTYTNYQINELDKSTNYEFVIQAINGCAGGDLSLPVSTSFASSKNSALKTAVNKKSHQPEKKKLPTAPNKTRHATLTEKFNLPQENNYLTQKTRGFLDKLGSMLKAIFNFLVKFL